MKNNFCGAFLYSRELATHLLLLKSLKLPRAIGQYRMSTLGPKIGAASYMKSAAVRSTCFASFPLQASTNDFLLGQTAVRF